MELGSSKLRKLLEEFVRSCRKVRPVRKCCHLIESTVSRDLRHLSKIEKKTSIPRDVHTKEHVFVHHQCLLLYTLARQMVLSFLQSQLWRKSCFLDLWKTCRKYQSVCRDRKASHIWTCKLCKKEAPGNLDPYFAQLWRYIEYILEYLEY